MTSDTEQETAADETFDVIVIGGGPVGENVADRAGRTGLSVALVEAELVGGECSYWACIPSKTLLRPGAVRAEARGVPGADVADGLDVPAILARRDTMVADWDDAGQVSWVEGAGITLVRGLGRIVGPRLVEVVPEDADADPDGLPRARRLAARHAVVVATGSVPVLPDVPGLADVNPWTSREATSVEEVPESIAIVGGGVVAAEMAFAFTDLGARVTVLSRGGQLGRTVTRAGLAVAASVRSTGSRLRTRRQPHAVLARARARRDGARPAHARPRRRRRRARPRARAHGRRHDARPGARRGRRDRLALRGGRRHRARRDDPPGQVPGPRRRRRRRGALRRRRHRGSPDRGGGAARRRRRARAVVALRRDGRRRGLAPGRLHAARGRRRRAHRGVGARRRDRRARRALRPRERRGRVGARRGLRG